jgi:hypothetical protein
MNTINFITCLINAVNLIRRGAVEASAAAPPARKNF